MPNLVQLHDRQIEFFDSPALYRGFVGGRGSGKSFVGAVDLLCKARPGRTYLVASPTAVIMGDTTFPTLKALGQRFGAITDIKRTPYPVVTLRNHATIRFRTAEDPEKMRGPNLSGVWLDEASLMDRDAYDIVIAALREAGEQGWLSATFTPKGPTHWTYEVFATGGPDAAIFKARTADNPFNPADFEATLQRQYGDTQWARQELGGEFVQLEGAEFPPELVDRPGRWFTDWPPAVASVIALDPSKGAREDSDYQAFVVVKLDQHNTLWVDAEAHRIPVIDMVTRGLDLAKLHRPDRLVIEDNDQLGLLMEEFRRQCQMRHQTVPLWGHRNTLNKTLRIRRLGGYLSNSHAEYGPQLRIRDTPGGKLLRAQLLDFPMGEHDDLIDALELAIRHFEGMV